MAILIMENIAPVEPHRPDERKPNLLLKKQSSITFSLYPAVHIGIRFVID